MSIQIPSQNTILFHSLFNQEQSQQLVIQKLSHSHSSNHQFNTIIFQNVGIKIMKNILRIFQDQDKQVKHIELNYNWNEIMVIPQLVCYDKNSWKTLQQLSNWNKEWNQLFSSCYHLSSIDLNLVISWMDQEYIKSLLQGLTKLPNLRTVNINVKSKLDQVQKMLNAFKQANIFQQFNFTFSQF